MAKNTVVQDTPANPCCSVWKEKYTKLEQRCTKLEDGRKSLRHGIKIIEQQIGKMETENQNLKKACEEERMRVENERLEKEKGLEDRAALEDEISDLKSQILSLQQKEGLGVEHVNEEVIALKARLSEVEAEKKRFSDLLEKERKRADTQKKKAEAEAKKSNEASKNAKAEKSRADKEREEKVKESTKRVALEDEITELKSQILSLQQKEGFGVENTNEEVIALKARLSEVEAENKRFSDLLEKERKRADSQKKKAEAEAKRSNEANQNAKEEKSRADKEREERVKESEKRVALENEISDLKSQILLQQKEDLGVEHAKEEAIALKARLSEVEAENKRFNDLLEKERKRADSQKKKAEAEAKSSIEANQTAKAEKSRADKEREEKVKESEKRVALEKEISSLKSEILLLQKIGSPDKHVDEEVKHLQAILSEVEAERSHFKELLEEEKKKADEEKKLAKLEAIKADEYRLQLEKIKAEAEELKSKLMSEIAHSEEAEKKHEAEKQKAIMKACEEESVRTENEREEKEKGLRERASLEDEISALKSQILLLQQKECMGVEEMISLKAHLSEVVAEKKQLNDLFEKERERADSQKKKAEAEEIKAAEACQNAQAEKSRADKEIEEKIRELDKRIALEKEISSLKLEMLSLQQNIGTRDKDVDQDVTLLKAQLSGRESEISQFKELLKKEKKKAEAEKKKANEEKRVANVERKKAEDYKLQLEKLNAEADEMKSKLVLETANSEDAKKKLVAEKQKAIKEKKWAEAEMNKVEQQKNLAEKYKMKATEEKSIADNLSQQLEFEKGRSEKLQKQLDEWVNADKLKDRLQLKRQSGESKLNSETKKRLEEEKQKTMHEKRRAEEQAKIAEAFKEKAMEEKNHAGRLAQELIEHKQKIEELQRLLPLDETKRTIESDKLKLLRKQLKFERMQVKHAKEVAKLEKGRSSILQHEICRLKDEFRQCSDHLEILDGCFSLSDVDIDLGKTGKKLLGTEPLLPMLGGNFPESVSGIDSQLVPLLRGSNRKTLQNCPINSSLGSFSDRPLVGSQGRRAVSVSESAKLAEEKKSNPQPNICQLPGDLTTTIVACNENIAAVAESNARSPLKTGTKRKRILDAVASVEHLHSEGQKLHLQLSESLAVLHDMLGSQENSDARKEKSRKKRRVDVQNCSEQNDKVVFKGNKEPKDDLGISDITDGDYMKLFKFDNSDDERTYHLAMARPLSPLPEIYLNCIDKFKTKKQLAVGNANYNLVPHCNSDAMNTETKLDDTDHVPPLQKEYNIDTFGTAVNENACANKIYEVAPTISCGSYNGPECSYRPTYCAVFSDVDDSSASKVFSATRTCFARCPVISEKDWVVQNLISALSKVEGLLLKEKVCVFFSLLMHNISRVTLENDPNFSDGDFTILNSFVEEMRNVMSDEEARNKFEQICNLDELHALFEDFLINRTVLVCTDKSSDLLPDSDQMADNSLNSEEIILSAHNASTKQLVTGAAVVASLFAAINQIGFICETSCNILRLRKIDSSVLTILHVFAHICGSKYFTLDDHHLMMTVIKSLVVFVVGVSLSVDSGLVPPPDFQSCTNCPFSEGAICIDLVVSMLLGKLENSQADVTESLQLTNLEGGSHRDENERSSVHNLEDTLFLLELVAYTMSWDWTCNNIVPQLLKLTESCASENLMAAIVILLGQIGRFGVDAKGHEDSGVQNMRDRLSAILCQITSRKTGLAVQVATVSALLAVISLKFEEVIKKSCSESPLLVSNSTPASNCIVKWFSVLNKDQQSMSVSLLSAVAC